MNRDVYVGLIEWARANVRNSALFTPWGQREAAKLTVDEIGEIFGFEEAQLVEAIRSGRIVKG